MTCEGLAECEWIRGVFEEPLHRRRSCRPVKKTDSAQHVNPSPVCVIDATRGFDHVIFGSAGGLLLTSCSRTLNNPRAQCYRSGSAVTQWTNSMLSSRPSCWQATVSWCLVMFSVIPVLWPDANSDVTRSICTDTRALSGKSIVRRFIGTSTLLCFMPLALILIPL